MPDDIFLPCPSDFMSPVLSAVLRAGEMIRQEFHRQGGPRGAYDKAPIDVEVELFLQKRLMDVHPCDWHGEELPRQFTGHPDVWIVDPHDGTSAFLRGMRGSAVSVALLRRGGPVLGFVYAPLAPDDDGDMIYWVEGMAPIRGGQPLAPIGSEPTIYGESGGVPWRPLPADPRPYDHATILAMNERAADHALENHTRFAPAGVLALPSIAYRLALVAAGEADAAVSLTKGLDSYDIAGGHALILAAGGTLCDIDGVPIVHDGRTFNGCVGGRPEIVSEVVRRRPSPGRAVPRWPVQPERRDNDPDVLRRAQGALLGLLVGDALGSQVEFETPEKIARAFPDGLRNLLPGGTWNLIAGQPTDDGEMALSLARALIDARRFDPQKVAQAYINWQDSNPFDIGATTTRGIDALRDRGSPSLDSQANGALMRVAPIGIACAGTPERAAAWARDDAALTHPHAVCRAASAAYAAAISAGIAGADPETMQSIAYLHAGDDAGADEIRLCLDKARDAPLPDLTRSQGWVLLAFRNAFHRLHAGQNLAEALTTTVMAGGDTDTNAAICGALLGAAQGYGAIPVRWRNHVLSCRPVAAYGVAHPRPAAFWPDDAMDVAEALLQLRRPLAEIEQMTAKWVYPFWGAGQNS